ncbi:hypothetical protein [Desulfonatronum thioautotrophicum]|nr:hypothetical protein [Desulfonatronum thioautotrophicum]
MATHSASSISPSKQPALYSPRSGDMRALAHYIFALVIMALYGGSV